MQGVANSAREEACKGLRKTYRSSGIGAVLMTDEEHVDALTKELSAQKVIVTQLKEASKVVDAEGRPEEEEEVSGPVSVGLVEAIERLKLLKAMLP